MSSRTIVLAAALLASVAIPATAQAAPDFRAEVTTLTNAERAKAGCGALSRHTALDAASQGHAEDMAKNNYFSHTGRDGSSPFDRTKRAGYPSNSAQGENIAAGYRDAAAVVAGWMSSPGHRRNILNCKYKSIGVGYATATSGQWRTLWVQNFGSV
ncbi:hypothetical protein Lesp02_12580 [Lentzea sp. NBRC 105346]|uniref:CAP domain-containing protein n=1 Tax=Lentzea sp. NBRC 105346 TaxID=3032205 RepID=UPI0024A3FCF1|nr:CAP domain-containing protein [Lentzea sp. NBRC 105346]GLZ29068.1 hypothetical protein Lesp02_12580 [Lentzea sp. NBRC 105346]